VAAAAAAENLLIAQRHFILAAELEANPVHLCLTLLLQHLLAARPCSDFVEQAVEVALPLLR
jgi:hypothetical protein